MPSYTTAQITEKIEGRLEGDPKILIDGASDVRSAEPSQISFFSDQRYFALAQKTKAGVLIVASTQTGTFPCPLIYVDSPYQAFEKTTELFTLPPLTYEQGIHPQAFVSPNVEIHASASIGAGAIIQSQVKIGARSVISPGVFVGENSQIGEDTLIYPSVVIRESSQIGSHVIIHSGAVIGSDGFGYELKNGVHKKIPQKGFVRIDDHVEIGSNTTIDRGRFDKTWIGEGSKIDNLVQIAHNVILGKHCIIVAQVGIAGSTVLGDYVVIGGRSGVAGHLEIGSGTQIGAATGVSKSVPPQSTLAGIRSRAVPLQRALKIEVLQKKLPELYHRILSLEKKFKDE